MRSTKGKSSCLSVLLGCLPSATASLATGRRFLVLFFRKRSKSVTSQKKHKALFLYTLANTRDRY